MVEQQSHSGTMMVFFIAIVSIVAIVAMLKSPEQRPVMNVVGGAAKGGIESHVVQADEPFSLFLGESRSVSIEGEGSKELSLTSLIPGLATIAIESESEKISLGDTELVSGMAVTLLKADKDRVEMYVMDSDVSCGDVDGQSPFCRGSSACCGGVCTHLPDCTGRRDGPVLECGQRSMYCCSGELSLYACGGNK